MVETDNTIRFYLDNKEEFNDFILKLLDDINLAEVLLGKNVSFINNNELFMDIYLLEPNSIEIRKLNEKKILIPYELYSTSKILNKRNILSESFIIFNLLNNPNIRFAHEENYIIISFHSDYNFMLTDIKLKDYKKLLKQIDFRSSVNYEKILNSIYEIDKNITATMAHRKAEKLELEKVIKKLDRDKKSLYKYLDDDEKLLLKLKD